MALQDRSQGGVDRSIAIVSVVDGLQKPIRLAYLTQPEAAQPCLAETLSAAWMFAVCDPDFFVGSALALALIRQRRQFGDEPALHSVPLGREFADGLAAAHGGHGSDQ
ncbi:hypothetical protein [Caballeronia concitans]|uniref:hypothetical protein n=1 Tax=Caballeronia concitans TaxID=1777133 RepID=UPI001FCC0298|nr:hypothetical protein [Caballeronia concitans]